MPPRKISEGEAACAVICALKNHPEGIQLCELYKVVLRETSVKISDDRAMKVVGLLRRAQIVTLKGATAYYGKPGSKPAYKTNQEPSNEFITDPDLLKTVRELNPNERAEMAMRLAVWSEQLMREFQPLAVRERYINLNAGGRL